MAPAYWSPFPILRYTAKCAGTSSRPVVVPTDLSAFCGDREFESHFLQRRVSDEPVPRRRDEWVCSRVVSSLGLSCRSLPSSGRPVASTMSSKRIREAPSGRGHSLRPLFATALHGTVMLEAAFTARTLRGL